MSFEIHGASDTNCVVAFLIVCIPPTRWNKVPSADADCLIEMIGELDGGSSPRLVIDVVQMCHSHPCWTWPIEPGKKNDQHDSSKQLAYVLSWFHWGKRLFLKISRVALSQ